MANRQSVILVLVILLSGTAVGALAGYRMHLASDLEEARGPVTTSFVIEWPDDEGPYRANVIVEGANATALGVTKKAAEQGNVTLRLQQASLGVYIHQLGDHPAEGRCGWIYFVGHEGNEPEEGELAADRTPVFDNGTLIWRWGCI